MAVETLYQPCQGESGTNHRLTSSRCNCPRGLWHRPVHTWFAAAWALRKRACSAATGCSIQGPTVKPMQAQYVFTNKSHCSSFLGRPTCVGYLKCRPCTGRPDPSAIVQIACWLSRAQSSCWHGRRVSSWRTRGSARQAAVRDGFVSRD